MHNVDDLILNIDESYKECDERLRKIYKREFENYSVSKLEQVWQAIEENHSYAKAPELGNIFKYMGLVGITRTKPSDTFYKRCTELNKIKGEDGTYKKDAEGDYLLEECGIKYSTKSKFCPKCNSFSRMNKALYGTKDKQGNIIKTLVVNSHEVVKCEKLPQDLRVLNELCSTCVKYQNNSLVRGSKCSAWNTHDEYKKSTKKCHDCSCYDCCNEKPMNGIQRATISLNKTIKKV